MNDLFTTGPHTPAPEAGNHDHQTSGKAGKPPARREDPRAAGGPADGRRSAAASLELKGDNPTWGDEPAVAVFKPHRCKLRVCPKCGVRYGWKVRQGLLPKAELFKRTCLLTLTVDRKNFESPEDAYLAVTDDGLIARLMRFLKIKRYVWVLEFQSLTGLGWPHWHIVIDPSDLPRNRVDLERAWHLWRDRWGIGGVDLQVRRTFNDASHALNYVTKYLTKPSPMGYPIWLLHLNRKVRFFQTSRAIGAVLSTRPTFDPNEANGDGGVGDPTTPEDLAPEDFDAEASTGEKRERPKASFRTLAARAVECGHFSHVYRESTIAGEKRFEFLGTIPIRPGRLMWLHHTGKLNSNIRIREQVYTFADSEVIQREVVLDETRRKSAGELVDRLKSELDLKGEFIHNALEIERRKQQLIDHNKFTQREAAKGTTEGSDLPDPPEDEIPF